MVSASIRQEAQSAHTRQDYVKAERLYRFLLKTKAEAVDALNLGALLRSTGRSQEAIRHYRKWLTHFPNEKTLRLNAINCALEANETSASKEWIITGIKKHPNNNQLKICEAKQSLAEGSYQDAVNKLIILSKKEQSNENIWHCSHYHIS